MQDKQDKESSADEVQSTREQNKIPMGLLQFCIDLYFRPHCGPGVDTACNKNEYQKYLLRVKAAGA